VDVGLVKVGCCGFAIPPARYMTRFPVVEVQQTFYQPPKLAILERWRAQAPPDFEFTLKAWQLITHLATSPTYKRLKAPLSPMERKECGAFQPSAIVYEAWLATRACAEALRAQRVVFQCPASFGPTEQNIANLRAFFLRIKRRGIRLLWEPRGEWPDGLVEGLCRELDLGHVVEPFLRPGLTREFFYYRVLGGRDYQHRFNDQELLQLLGMVPADTPGYVMFNNLTMFEDATRFRTLLEHPEMAWRQVA
jgi:uncharacterized protein YecE (DUF72 family)